MKGGGRKYFADLVSHNLIALMSDVSIDLSKNLRTLKLLFLSYLKCRGGESIVLFTVEGASQSTTLERSRVPISTLRWVRSTKATFVLCTPKYIDN